MHTILVTGATGHVGQEVVRALLRRGARVIAGERRPHRVAALFGERVVATHLDFQRRATWAPSLDGVEHLFLMRPPAIADVGHTLNPFIDTARSLGVQHVVFLSAA